MVIYKRALTLHTLTRTVCGGIQRRRGEQRDTGAPPGDSGSSLRRRRGRSYDASVPGASLLRLARVHRCGNGLAGGARTFRNYARTPPNHGQHSAETIPIVRGLQLASLRCSDKVGYR